MLNPSGPTSPRILSVTAAADLELPANGYSEGRMLQNQGSATVLVVPVRNDTDRQAGASGGTRGGTVGFRIVSGQHASIGPGEYRLRSTSGTVPVYCEETD